MIAALSARDRTGRRGLVLPRRSDRDPGPRADPEWMLAGPNSLLLTTHSGPRGADVPQGSLSERPRGSRGQTEFLVELKTRSDPIGCMPSEPTPRGPFGGCPRWGRWAKPWVGYLARLTQVKSVRAPSDGTVARLRRAALHRPAVHRLRSRAGWRRCATATPYRRKAWACSSAIP